MGDSATGPRTVTIFDVAAAAGVSTATVSRVANGHANIRAETRARVIEAMDQLGYVANTRARGLARGKTDVIGLLVEDLGSSYITQIAKGVDTTVAARGYDVMLATMHLREQRSQYVHHLFNGLVDGLIVLLSPGFEPYLAEVAARDFPTVLIDHAPTEHAPVVNTDNRAGTRAAIDHLVELGHRRIGFITGLLDVESGRDRLEAYRAGLEDAGMSVDESLIREGDYLADSARTETGKLLDLEHPPTAIMASSDMAAFGALQSASERGLRVPDDLSVIGFDDIPEAGYVVPALTTVRQPMGEMGRVASDVLIDVIAGVPHNAEVIELPTELVIRSTTAPPRG